MIPRANQRRHNSIARFAKRPAQFLVLALVIVGATTVLMSPVHSLWSKNLVIKGDAQTREIPDKCKDMHFDNYLWGTDHDDKINGTSGNDMIWGLTGHDEIYGQGGDDCFDGGDDDDKCDDGDGWYDASTEHDFFSYSGEHTSTRDSCEQWGNTWSVNSWWHHSVPTIELSWEPVEGAVYYNVYRSTTAGGPYESLGSTETAAYTDSGVLEDVAYYYVFTAVDASGFESVPSAEAAQLVPSGAAAVEPTPDPASEPAPTDIPVKPAEPSPDGTIEPTATPEPTPSADVTPEPTPEPAVPTKQPVPTKETPAPEPASEPTPAPPEAPIE